MKPVTRKAMAPFRASVYMGLQRGYGEELLDKQEIISRIQQYQDTRIREADIYLSAAISDTTIVLRGQHEPHLVLGFINYPKFPMEENALKSEIEQLATTMMMEFAQNRMVIAYPDETVMLEQSEDTDWRIHPEPSI